MNNLIKHVSSDQYALRLSWPCGAWLVQLSVALRKTVVRWHQLIHRHHEGTLSSEWAFPHRISQTILLRTTLTWITMLHIVKICLQSKQLQSLTFPFPRFKRSCGKSSTQPWMAITNYRQCKYWTSFHEYISRSENVPDLEQHLQRNPTYSKDRKVQWPDNNNTKTLIISESTEISWQTSWLLLLLLFTSTAKQTNKRHRGPWTQDIWTSSQYICYYKMLERLCALWLVKSSALYLQ